MESSFQLRGGKDVIIEHLSVGRVDLFLGRDSGICKNTYIKGKNINIFLYSCFFKEVPGCINSSFLSSQHERDGKTRWVEKGQAQG